MKKSNIKNFALSVCAVAAIASCSAVSSSKVGTAQPNLSNTQWKLADEVKGNVPTLSIENGKVNGNAGCNNYCGALTLDATAGNFVAENLGVTRKMCENMSVEDNFLKMLQQANKYVVSGNTLQLYKDQLLLLKFNKQ